MPLEVHAYYHFNSSEQGFNFDVRYVLVSLATGLETPSDTFNYRSSTPRFRTRTMGLPLPPVLGSYELRVDWRVAGSNHWSREPIIWPLSLVEVAPEPPRITH